MIKIVGQVCLSRSDWLDLTVTVHSFRESALGKGAFCNPASGVTGIHYRVYNKCLYFLQTNFSYAETFIVNQALEMKFYSSTHIYDINKLIKRQWQIQYVFFNVRISLTRCGVFLSCYMFN